MYLAPLLMEFPLEDTVPQCDGDRQTDRGTALLKQYGALYT